MTAPRASLAGLAIKGQPPAPERPDAPPAPRLAALTLPPGAAAPMRPGTVSMNVRFPPEVHQALKTLSFTSGRPISEHILDAVDAYMKRLA